MKLLKVYTAQFLPVDSILCHIIRPSPCWASTELDDELHCLFINQNPGRMLHSVIATPTLPQDICGCNRSMADTIACIWILTLPDEAEMLLSERARAPVFKEKSIRHDDRRTSAILQGIINERLLSSRRLILQLSHRATNQAPRVPTRLAQFADGWRFQSRSLGSSGSVCGPPIDVGRG